jgi:hypothetical protein
MPSQPKNNMPAPRYDYFKYHLPPEPAETYAKRAIAILQEIRKRWPKFYLQLRAPSEVLTLSGVRAFDTYYDFGKTAPQKDIADLSAYLESHGILLVLETYPFIGEQNREHNYSLVHQSALADIPNRYGFVPEWQDLHFAGLHCPTDFFLWWLFWKDRIGGTYGRIKKMPAAWSNNWSHIHDITFGMLLGYPGEAICSVIRATNQKTGSYDVLFEYDMAPEEIQKYQANGTLVMHSADIAHVDKFDGAQPRYDYAAALQKNPHIRAHQTLWSGILTEVYRALGELD